MVARVRHPAGLRRAAACLAALGLAALGLSCGPTAVAPVAVEGTVTFQGEPVTEGLIQFSNDKTGRGAEAALAADGTYRALLYPDTYTVIILPPIVLVVAKETPPDTRFKAVKNVPVKYRNTTTSGLTAEVAKDKAVHNFDMKP
jgi:hypothetical protein